MIHTNYTFYRDVYNGTKIPDETAFNSVLPQSAAFINYLTRGRAAKMPVLDAVNFAVCAVADVSFEEEAQGDVTSESVGNHSRTYARKSSAEVDKIKVNKAMMYLSGTGLLYGGMS